MPSPWNTESMPLFHGIKSSVITPRDSALKQLNEQILQECATVSALSNCSELRRH
jgi:hypothetical protein